MEIQFLPLFGCIFQYILIKMTQQSHLCPEGLTPPEYAINEAQIGEKEMNRKFC
jgi:hypothetical protein